MKTSKNRLPLKKCYKKRQDLPAIPNPKLYGRCFSN